MQFGACSLTLFDLQYLMVSMHSVHSTPTNQFKDLGPDTEVSKIEISTDLPKSSIVHNEVFTDFEKAGMLYDKYIAVGSEYQINIGAAERNRLKARFEIEEESIIKSLTGTFLGSGSSGNVRGKVDKSENPRFMSSPSNSTDMRQLAFEFDSCCETLLKLLGYSLSRFRTKPLYHKMAELL